MIQIRKRGKPEKTERKETESLQSQYPQKNCDCPVGAAGGELPVCRL